MVILIFDIPTAFIIIFSEPLIKLKNANNEEKNTINGRVKYIRLKKLRSVNCVIIFKGIFLPADFLNCSTKSPINKITAKTINVIKNENKIFLRYIC